MLFQFFSGKNTETEAIEISVHKISGDSIDFSA
jgi:hypothetical protein